MVIRIELSIFDQGVTSARFWPKKGSDETLNTIVYQTTLLAKLPPRGFILITFMKYSGFGENAEKNMKIDSYVFKYNAFVSILCIDKAHMYDN